MIGTRSLHRGSRPSGIRAQMEGCIGFALGAPYYSEIDLAMGD
jgi:hypothetical protein